MNQNNDKQIASNIVRFIFFNIGRCVREDRSKVKLSWWEKSSILTMLGEKVLAGILNYILNMYDTDVKELLDGIEFQIEQRKKLREMKE